jgi:hypothetical protein
VARNETEMEIFEKLDEEFKDDAIAKNQPAERLMQVYPKP